MAAALLALAGCRSAEERAALLESQSDQQVAGGNIAGGARLLGAATAADANNSQLWLKLGRLQLQLNNPVAAQIAFQRAAELAPDSIEALENLAVLAVRGNELADAKRYMEPLLVLQPNDAAGLLAQGAIALRERRNADAVAASDQLLAANPELGESYVMKARALAAVGRKREAIDVLEKRSRAEGDPASVGEILTLLLDQYRDIGDVAGVRSVARRLHERDPSEPRYAMETARALHAEGKDGEADALLADLQRQHPGSVGLIGAIADYRRAALPPAAAMTAVVNMAAGSSQAVRVMLANRLIDMNFPAEAVTLLGAATRGPVTAASVDAVTTHARALVAAGRLPAAMTLVDRVLAFDPANVAALVVRARLYLEQRNWSAALADAQLARSGDLGSQEAALAIGAAYAGQGSPVMAQSAYAQAVQAFPGSFAVLKTYSDWLLAAGRASDAVFPLATFARSHPRDSAVWTQYARVCAAAGDPCLAEARAGVPRAG